MNTLPNDYDYPTNPTDPGGWMPCSRAELAAVIDEVERRWPGRGPRTRDALLAAGHAFGEKNAGMPPKERVVVDGQIVGVALDPLVLGRLAWSLRGAREALPCPWCKALGPHHFGGHDRDGVLVPSCPTCRSVASLPDDGLAFGGQRPDKRCSLCGCSLKRALGILIGGAVFPRCPSCGEIDGAHPKGEP